METNFGVLKIKSTFKGDKRAPWGDDRLPENWNRHIVRVTKAGTKLATTFDFWGSQVDPEIQNELQLLNAFECFVNDAMSGMSGFEEFCADFGYDTDSRSAEKTWKACRRALEKLRKFVFIDDDIYELQRALAEEIQHQLDVEVEAG